MPTKAVLVCHQEPRPVGHGGHRRAYQIRTDLEEALGPENVFVTDDIWRHYRRRSLRQRLADLGDNPWKLGAPTHFSRHLYAFPGFLQHYESLLSGLEGPVLSVVEHAGFASLLPINERRGVRTVICPQNIESFDTALMTSGRWASHARAIDFANELAILGRCEDRLLISKVEAGLLGGLGLASRFYPYRAAGEVRERLLRIRERRRAEDVEAGLFLMLGTAAHESTRDAMAWFVERMADDGLARGMRLVVAGLETDRLLPDGVRVPALELRGWVDEHELDSLLVRAAAVVLPQRMGFGALTRVAELACAGLPLLISRHASLAIDLPPEARAVDDEWIEWRQAMDEVLEGAPASTGLDAYVEWEAAQPRPLNTLATETV